MLFTHYLARIFITVIFCVSAALLCAGCKIDDEGDVSLDGTWATEYDSYIINLAANAFEYDDGGWGTGFSGTIEEIVQFNNAGTAGIIFIEYTIKPIDYAAEAPPDGDFIGIYFRNLTGSTGQFAPPVEEYENGKYRTPAKASLDDAKTAFTKDTAGDYVFYWVTYAK